MEFRPLGDSGLLVSAVAYGNWLTDRGDRGQSCVTAALDAGITTFDTADVYGAPDYGSAERSLGEALRGVRRESVEILTKVCLRTGPGPNDQGLSRKHVMESCHASLRRLGTDYLDVYQAHRFDDGTPVEETLVALADLVRHGKVRYVGVSEWTAAQLDAAVRLARELGVRLVSNQAQYSLLWRVIEAEVVPACDRLGVSQIAFGALAHGVLTGKYAPTGGSPTGSRGAGGKGARFVNRYRSGPVLRAGRRLAEVARDAHLTPAQLAVAWVLGNPAVSTVIVGGSRPEQVRQNAGAVGHKLDPDVLARMDAALVDPEHGDLVERDPAKTARLFDVKPSWSSSD